MSQELLCTSRATEGSTYFHRTCKAGIRLFKACPGMFSQHLALGSGNVGFLWFKLAIRIASTI